MWDELPPCFAAHCDKCGWKGRLPSPLYYVVGADYPVVESPPYKHDKCPSCGRLACRKADPASFVARLRYAVDRLAAMPGRGTDVFPCGCPHTPSCRLAGEVRVGLASYSDAFVTDEDWTRVSATVKCNGCYAEGGVSLLERFPSAYLWRLDREWYDRVLATGYGGLVIG